MKWQVSTLAVVATLLAGCATTSDQGTLAELQQVKPDTEEVLLSDSLDRAAQSYRRFLEETAEGEKTPEAMRRLADLQLEREYGHIVGGQVFEMAAPESSASVGTAAARSETSGQQTLSESDSDFERRATGGSELLPSDSELDVQLPDGGIESIPLGPREAIDTYRELLESYPNYERNDQVLYQMSRAHDELGQTDEAMQVIERLVAEYPDSRYIDEVNFRRGEYYFVRKRFLDAEEAYGSIISMGESSAYYELALYKLGWTLYKQEFYEEALKKYMTMLDYRQSIGYDFDRTVEEVEEHRVSDTFRVISLSFSNLGGTELVDEYFAEQGSRTYTDRIYANLGEFFFSKLRYDDAASAYKSFVRLNPLHRVSPHFSMRVIEIYAEGGFPQLVVEAKKDFSTDYSLSADYWNSFDAAESPEVVELLKTNLTDLANHYHAMYQDEGLVDEKPASFKEAQHWYREFLDSFPSDSDSPPINYQLADLLLESEDFAGAASEYERTAYNYDPHDQASAAGYAAIYAYREDLKLAEGARQGDVKQLTVDSSLRFADTFREHEQAPVVLGAAADDLYVMQDFDLAIQSARTLIERYPESDSSLLRSGWAVVAHSSIDIAEYADAEYAYMSVLQLTTADDETRAAVVDGLAAAIYKQGEQAILLEDYRAAADHYLRIKDVAATSSIRTAAEYDAAAALIKLADWNLAAGVLEDFRSEFPEHELNSEATKQLAFVYQEDGQIERSAAEYVRISEEASDPELSREALLTAGELYDQAESTENAIGVYERYVAAFPQPLDIALETRSRLAEIFNENADFVRYYDELDSIVAIDRDAGAERTDRSRFLASKAALVLAEQTYERFAELKLVLPFEESLAEKQRRMDDTLAVLENLVSYEVAEVTAAATYYIAETYFEFSAALLASERPAGLSAAERLDYEMVIEEEAYPFEERAIEVHEQNFELLAGGIHNAWVQDSLDKLSGLMPGRYAKNEMSAGFVGSMVAYAYRMPIVPEIGLGPDGEPEGPDAKGVSVLLDASPEYVPLPGEEQ
jgi:TolA-binding protein